MDILNLYGYILLANTLFFLVLFSYSDLKTSLIDARYVYTMLIISFIVHLVFAFLLKTYTYLLYAFAGSFIFFFLGYVLYFSSKWGEGDALLLGSVIFSYPYPFFVPLQLELFSKVVYYWYVLFFNMSFIGVFYSLLYAFIFSLRNRIFYKEFFRYALSLKGLLYISLISLILSAVIYMIFNQVLLSLLGFILSFVMFWIFVFSKLSDEILFTKKIKLKDVQEGDTVIGKFDKANFHGKRLDAITREDILKLIDAYGPNKLVEVKDMVRYIPSFLLGFVFTLFFGDILFTLLI